MTIDKKDKAIILLTLYILSLLIGVGLGWFYYGESHKNCNINLKQCREAYYNNCAVVKIEPIKDKYTYDFDFLEVNNETRENTTND